MKNRKTCLSGASGYAGKQFLLCIKNDGDGISFKTIIDKDDFVQYICDTRISFFETVLYSKDEFQHSDRSLQIF